MGLGNPQIGNSTVSIRPGEAIVRIVHIQFGKVNPDALNGVSKLGHWMATYQFRLGHDVEVWGLAKSMTLTPRPREYKMRLFPITRLRTTLGPEIRAALSLLEPGTWVHFHSVFCPEFSSIAAVLRKRGIRYGVTPHGGYSPGVLRKNALRKRLYIAMREQRYLAGASWIQATGLGEVKDILSIAPDVNIGLIPNGQELDLLKGVEVSQMASEHPVIGYCGRLTIHQKGLDFLLPGFSAYRSSGGCGQLWLVGDDPDRPIVERMAAEGGFQNDVKFFGAMNGTAKLEVIANFDLFIHSSRWEGLPTACLEAASLGKPLLVSRETNLAEYVERSGAGLVLDETSAPGVMRALLRAQRLNEDNQLREMGAKARLLVEKEFSWEENAMRFVAAIAATGFRAH
jgi:glycosyltransferase involved in cell wall biosynthesis